MVGKVCIWAKWLIYELIPISLAWSNWEYFYSPLDGMLVHCWVTPSINFAGTHLYPWVERGTVRVKCLAQEHNTRFTARAKTKDPETSALTMKVLHWVQQFRDPDITWQHLTNPCQTLGCFQTWRTYEKNQSIKSAKSSYDISVHCVNRIYSPAWWSIWQVCS